MHGKRLLGVGLAGPPVRCFLGALEGPAAGTPRAAGERSDDPDVLFPWKLWVQQVLWGRTSPGPG